MCTFFGTISYGNVAVQAWLPSDAQTPPVAQSAGERHGAPDKRTPFILIARHDNAPPRKSAAWAETSHQKARNRPKNA